MMEMGVSVFAIAVVGVIVVVWFCVEMEGWDDRDD